MLFDQRNQKVNVQINSPDKLTDEEKLHIKNLLTNAKIQIIHNNSTKALDYINEVLDMVE